MLTNALVKLAAGDVLLWRTPIDLATAEFNITGAARELYFLAQCAHESQSFSRLKENMRYSAARLLAVFPRYFTPSEAERMAYDERAIAERVYGGRMGNAIEGLGDGYRFIARGALGITGRAMYERCGKALGLPLLDQPELLCAPVNAARSAAWFWKEHGCNELADAGDFLATTKKINGGVNGQADREAWLAKLQAAAQSA